MPTIDQIPPEYREILVDLVVRLGERVVRDILKILRKPPGDLPELLADALARMGQSQYREAIEALSKALKHPLSNDSRGVVMLLMAQCHNNVGDWDQTEEYAGEAVQQATKANSRALYAAALNVKGVAHAQRSQYALAESVFNEALNVASELPARDIQATSLVNLAGLSLERHDPTTAEQLTRRAYGLAANDPLIAGICLVNWSVVDRRRVHAIAAYNKLHKAVFLFRQVAYLLGEADAFAGLAILSGEIGDLLAAEGYFRRSLELSKATKSVPREALAYRGLAKIEFMAEHIQQSRQLYRKALKLCRQVGDRAGIARVNGELGIIAGRMEKPKLAIKHFQEALSAFQEINDPLGRATTLANLGNVYAEIDQHEAAEASLREALAIQEKLGNKPGQVATLVSLGRVALKQGDKPAVENVIRHARRLLDESVAFGPDLQVLAYGIDRLESDSP